MDHTTFCASPLALPRHRHPRRHLPRHALAPRSCHSVHSPPPSSSPPDPPRSRRAFLSSAAAAAAAAAGSTCGCGWRRSALALEGGDDGGALAPRLFSHEWEQKQFARSMETGMAQYEVLLGDVKRRLFRNAENVREGDSIVELGIGTGPNLRYYPSDCKVVGVDPNRFMYPYAREKVAGTVFTTGLTLNLVTGRGEELSSLLPANSFDVAVITLTLCSVADPAAVLSETRKVLRRGGRLLFIEHVGAPKGTPLRYVQTVLNPLQQWASDGCNLVRDTEAVIRGADGFRVEEMFNFRVAGLEAALIAPHVAGVAVAV